ncbi:hypothetical protein A2215_04750 [Candidatus Berkelbacteria bacterium RIFOXYA2_FULL_43_10]|uniref:Fibronectin type-III domain-containing protein n=1 Tax=Candidatus Berkelbacteria bacterium RIFOXYA2_FULL_43_10 TaxID=1797472 RepID=A0A1F5ECJ8_9BACT|nr:MAG: hypothetical protein A2215_04750 [Candidatus Berkelbacteria bacterium RIFOXYA2_FULL_43_10]
MSDYTIYYLADTLDPTNPSTVTANIDGDSVTSTSWTANDGTLNFIFSGATDADSGLAGYYLYFGTASSADPATDGAYQAHVGAVGDNQNLTKTILTSDDGKYQYLRVKTKDIAGNISDAATLFELGYDITLPTRPTFVASDPAGYTTINSFDFSWPAGTDPNGPNGAGGIKWYEYKRATDVAWSHTADAATRIANDITSYQEGANAFYVRTVDNAGNISSDYQQVTYYYSGTAPAKPTDLSVDPPTSDSNSFTIHWHKPVQTPEESPVVGYWYSVNATPTVLNTTYVASSAGEVSIGPDSYATLQGENTIYILSQNEAGNKSYEASYVASTTFNCQTPAPPIPTSVTITDSSNRATEVYMLTTQWLAGTGQDPLTFDHYLVERSTNGVDFTTLATTASTAYIDASGLNNSTTYYYRIKSVDNAGKSSAASSIVSKLPTGKYLTPPAYTSQPASTTRVSTAIITWTTDRVGTSFVRYGTNPSSLVESTGSFSYTTNHSVTLAGLNPSTLYYFQTQSVDEFRDYTMESAYSTTYTFLTEEAPKISNVEVSNITVGTADIAFTTTASASLNIQYGTTSSYGNTQESAGGFTTNHARKLSNLNSETTYHFKIEGADQDGNPIASDDYSFTTLPMPKIENLKITEITGESSFGIKATWTTNVPTSTILSYTASGREGKEETSAKLDTNHEVTVMSLIDQTTYTIYAEGRDQFGNLAVSSPFNLNTPKDTRPPKLLNLQTESSVKGFGKESKAQIIVSWETDEDSTSKVEYGEGTSNADYSQSTSEDGTFKKYHQMIVSGLETKKTYHLRATSLDPSGNIGTSDNNIVITKKAKNTAWEVITDTFMKIFGWIHL